MRLGCGTSLKQQANILMRSGVSCQALTTWKIITARGAAPSCERHMSAALLLIASPYDQPCWPTVKHKQQRFQGTSQAQPNFPGVGALCPCWTGYVQHLDPSMGSIHGKFERVLT